MVATVDSGCRTAHLRQLTSRSMRASQGLMHERNGCQRLVWRRIRATASAWRKTAWRVGIGFGRGLAGIAGRRLARTLGIPRDGDSHLLEVTIAHDDAVLHWDRRFDDEHCFASTVRPCGRWPDGGWIEDTAAISLRPQVDVIDGGWYWRCVGAQRGAGPFHAGCGRAATRTSASRMDAIASA